MQVFLYRINGAKIADFLMSNQCFLLAWLDVENVRAQTQVLPKRIT